MKYIGAHVSIASGVENAPVNAANLKATAFAMFTKNQRQWNAKPLSKQNITSFKQNCTRLDFKAEQILPHDSYLINLGHPDKQKRKRSLVAFLDEIERCELLGLKMLNLHPGSSLGLISEADCLKFIADSLNKCHSQTAEIVTVVENTAGQGNNVGYRFEHLAELIDMIENKDRIGFCLDTCHLFAAGYDIRKRVDFENTMREFDNLIGFKYLRGLHLNDARSDFQSRVDRHASIGKGKIGKNAFKFIMNFSAFEDIPIILETPDNEIWDDEIRMLFKLGKKETA